ncbi:MAG: hypothetical protein KDB24_18080, partial [Microthrixaceae bacterium]|nr:hypothetical protein [Microthrixaceae bacterium]
LVLPIALTVNAFRSPSWRQMKRWATDAGVTITENNENMIRQRLGRARRYRSVTGLPFWWLAALPALDNGGQPAWTRTLVWIPLTAYALGSMWAAVPDPSPTVDTRAAVLTPRVPSRYVWTPARFAPWVLLGLSGLSLALTKPFPPRFPVSIRSEAPQLVIAALVAVLAELVIRLIASRPQPATTPSRIDADDALRSTGATAAIASALLVTTMAMSTAVNALLWSGHRMWIGVPLWVACGLATFAALTAIVNQAPWLPQRPRTVLTPAPSQRVDA